VQVPDIETSEIKTVVSVPDGGTVLLRGLRGSMSLGNDANARREVRNLLLFVKPTIILREAPQKAKLDAGLSE
jgi:hypothetical protein